MQPQAQTAEQVFEQAYQSRTLYLEVVRRAAPKSRVWGLGWNSWYADAPYRHYDYFPLNNRQRDQVADYKTPGRKVQVELLISGITGEILGRKVRRRGESFYREMWEGGRNFRVWPWER